MATAPTKDPEAISIAAIDLVNSPRVRSETRGEIIEEYANRYLANEKMPPVIVFENEGEPGFLLADGRHRLEAIKSLAPRLPKPPQSVKAIKYPGGYEEALTYALLANDRNGMRRSNEDKRRCVEAALEQWPDKTQKEIAELCGVSQQMISDARAATAEAKNVKGEIQQTYKRLDNESSDDQPKPVKLATPQPTAVKPRDRTKDAPATDSMGCWVPDGVAGYLQMDPEVQKIMTSISALKGFVEKIEAMQSGSNKMWVELNIGSAKADLDRLRANFKTCKSYALCNLCQGHPETQPKAHCTQCLGKGLISEFKWHFVRPEIKKMRELQIQNQRKEKTK